MTSKLASANECWKAFQRWPLAIRVCNQLHEFKALCFADVGLMISFKLETITSVGGGGSVRPSRLFAAAAIMLCGADVAIADASSLDGVTTVEGTRDRRLPKSTPSPIPGWTMPFLPDKVYGEDNLKEHVYESDHWKGGDELEVKTWADLALCIAGAFNVQAKGQQSIAHWESPPSDFPSITWTDLYVGISTEAVPVGFFDTAFEIAFAVALAKKSGIAPPPEWQCRLREST